MSLDETLWPELESRRRHQLYRSRRTLKGPQGVRVNIDGRELLNFCSNDYLGLANSEEARLAFIRAANEYGVGSGAAHLVSGHSRPHQLLEEELAEFVGRPRALLFSTGYMANLGVVSALAGVGDLVVEDRLNHASLLDAALLSRARLLRYPHGDCAGLALRLAKGGERRTLVVTDGVFSMDGDLAPLAGIAPLAEQAGAWLMVDDAHGLGVVGPGGRGTVAHFGLDAVPILVGTLGKAFGTFGAFVAGSEALIETLVQLSRSYIYTTALPPAVAEATRANLRLARDEEWRRDKLRRLIRQFRKGASELGLPLMPSETSIQPLLVGGAAQALALSRRLEEEGFLISAIRPPTVPEGSSRLRITFSALHEERHIEMLLDAFQRIAPSWQFNHGEEGE